jgi:hypothetical protein
MPSWAASTSCEERDHDAAGSEHLTDDPGQPADQNAEAPNGDRGQRGDRHPSLRPSRQGLCPQCAPPFGFIDADVYAQPRKRLRGQLLVVHTFTQHRPDHVIFQVGPSSHFYGSDRNRHDNILVARGLQHVANEFKPHTSPETFRIAFRQLVHHPSDFQDSHLIIDIRLTLQPFEENRMKIGYDHTLPRRVDLIDPKAVELESIRAHLPIHRLGRTTQELLDDLRKGHTPHGYVADIKRKQCRHIHLIQNSRSIDDDKTILRTSVQRAVVGHHIVNLPA